MPENRSAISREEGRKLTPGTKLPELVTRPVTRHDLALFCGGSGDHNPIHTDSDLAKMAGMGDVFVHGMLTMAYVGRMLTDWVDPRHLKSFGVRFGAIAHVGAPVTCMGEVVGTEDRDGTTLVRVAVKAVQNGEDKMAGEAVFAFN